MVSLTGNSDRMLNNTDNANDRTDENLTDRITKFQDVIKEDTV